MIEKLRNRLVKNFLTVTMVSLGLPMLLMGDEVRRTPEPPERLEADAEFTLAEYLYHAGHGDAAVPHFKEAQRLAPDN